MNRNDPFLFISSKKQTIFPLEKLKCNDFDYQLVVIKIKSDHSKFKKLG